MSEFNKQMFAKVVVDVKTNNLNETYDYIIPNELMEFIGVGSRVLVPFGYQDILGYVLSVSEESSFALTAKAIKEVLDYDQELTLEQINLASYISETYYVSIVNVLELMIPSFLKGQKRKYIVVKDYDKLHPDLAVLFKGKMRLPMNRKIEDLFEIVKNEIRKGNITLDYDLYTYGNGLKKKEYYIKDLNPVFKSEKRKIIYEYVKKHPGVSEDEIITYIDCTYNIIREMLLDKTLEYKEVPNLNTNNEKYENINKYTFSFDDSLTVEKYFHTKKRKFLLHSNKEDFKINFYIKVIEECKKNNLPVIITSPTIMLEEEILMFLKRYLRGYKIYGMSSKNNRKERYEVFMNIKYDNLDVLVTTHNGIFLPFNRIGAIIVLDEENPNYINENYPFYDARDVLRKRAEMHNASFILSSSSPSISTYYKAFNGEYIILSSIDNSFKENRKIVDMKEEILNGSDSIVSDSLKNAIKKALDNKNQVMLLVASKAYSGIVRCRSCGKILKCPHCNIPLTLYKEKGYAKCNYCDFKNYDYNKCSCGSEEMINLSFGEEKLNEVITEMFEDARILNINADLMKTSDDYNKALNDIEENNVDIIIGTNILSKTLKADNIKVVGVINADLYLNGSSHRANEYTYNLITKLGNKENVIIQTFYPNNDIINKAVNNDYESYYSTELDNRRLLDYDPIVEMNRIIITGEYSVIYHFANYFKKVYKGVIKGSILGPTYEVKHRGVKLVLKHNDFEKVIKILEDTKEHFKKERVLVNYERYPKVI